MFQYVIVFDLESRKFCFGSFSRPFEVNAKKGFIVDYLTRGASRGDRVPVVICQSVQHLLDECVERESAIVRRDSQLFLVVPEIGVVLDLVPIGRYQSVEGVADNHESDGRLLLRRRQCHFWNEKPGYLDARAKAPQLLYQTLRLGPLFVLVYQEGHVGEPGAGGGFVHWAPNNPPVY